MQKDVKKILKKLENLGFMVSEYGREPDDTAEYIIFADEDNNWITFEYYDDATSHDNNCVCFSAANSEADSSIVINIDTMLAFAEFAKIVHSIKDLEDVEAKE